jgi:UDP-N-acetylglucosamine 2-epimerase (non-hydrolysing)
MKTKTITIVYGTRPELIKLAPLIKTFKKSFNVNVVCTGQHKELLNNLYDWFDIQDQKNLEIMQENQSPSQVIARILESLDSTIEGSDFVVVQGDTATAFAASLTAFLHKIPVVHIEAGLRTDEMYNPFPEEMLRRQISRLATYHFAPTQRAVENLLREGISENVYLVGNTVIDALKETIQRIESNEEKTQKFMEPIMRDLVLKKIKGKKFLLVTMHRRENLGEEHSNLAKALKRVIKENPDLLIVFPVHPNPAVKEAIEPYLADNENVLLIPPVDYVSFNTLLKDCFIVVTDSGGVQEEACALGKPTIVFRKTTERPEAIEAGTAVLSGTEEENVYQEITKLLKDEKVYNSRSKPSNAFGEGNASELVLKILKQ